MSNPFTEYCLIVSAFFFHFVWSSHSFWLAIFRSLMKYARSKPRPQWYVSCKVVCLCPLVKMNSVRFLNFSLSISSEHKTSLWFSTHTLTHTQCSSSFAHPHWLFACVCFRKLMENNAKYVEQWTFLFLYFVRHLSSKFVRLTWWRILIKMMPKASGLGTISFDDCLATSRAQDSFAKCWRRIPIECTCCK